MRNHNQAEINSLIYTQLHPQGPTRYQMIKYATWRIFLYNELQSVPHDRKQIKNKIEKYSTRFPQLVISEDRKDFYDFLFKPSSDTLSQSYKSQSRNDNISHFICRMLYCQEEGTYQTFIELERLILENRLRRILNENKLSDKQNLMNKLKAMLAVFKEKQNSTVYHVPQQEWMKLKNFISFSAFPNEKKQQYARLYAKIPFYEGEAGIRRRRSYIRGGYVYVNTQSMIDIVLSNYESFLRKKLDKCKPVVQDLIVEDSENQFASFLITTIKQINQQGMQETKMDGKFNLTLKNIDSLNRYFPPCMLHLNQQLKINRHLKHDGRRQLWGFFKACGMDVYDNKQYFRKHFQGKVTASEMKGHMYNIEHIYGLQGKRKIENAWLCRNIITNGTAPKKGQHHGCPFYHWGPQLLSDFLVKNYRISDDNLKQVLYQKQQKHFQVACGRLFEYSEVNQREGSIPAEITSKLGRAPYLYYEAGMQLKEKKINEAELKTKKGSTLPSKKDIEF